MAKKDEIKAFEETKNIEPENFTPDLNKNVQLMNGTLGQLVIHSNFSNRIWNVSGFGKKFFMTLSDIVDVSNDQPIIFEQGWAVIMEQPIIEYLNYTELYKNIIKPVEMDRFLSMTEPEIKDILTDAPIGVKQTVAKIIKQKIDSKDSNMDSASKIKLFEELLNVKFDI